MKKTYTGLFLVFCCCKTEIRIIGTTCSAVTHTKIQNKLTPNQKQKQKQNTIANQKSKTKKLKLIKTNSNQKYENKNDSTTQITKL